jgi:drug/metabolite transporter (DMT)-like permease
MFVLVIFAYSCQIFITRSVFLVAASKVMPFNYVLVVVSFLADIVIFHHSFDALAIIGILVVCLGLLYLIRMEGKTEKTEDSKALRKASTVSQEGV